MLGAWPHELWTAAAAVYPVAPRAMLLSMPKGPLPGITCPPLARAGIPSNMLFSAEGTACQEVWGVEVRSAVPG
jgi:hypothetical protein